MGHIPVRKLLNCRRVMPRHQQHQWHHFRNLNLRYLPCIRAIAAKFQGIYTQMPPFLGPEIPTLVQQRHQNGKRHLCPLEGGAVANALSQIDAHQVPVQLAMDNQDNLCRAKLTPHPRWFPHQVSLPCQGTPSPTLLGTHLRGRAWRLQRRRNDTGVP